MENVELNDVQQKMLEWHLQQVQVKQGELNEARAATKRFLVAVTGDENALLDNGPQGPIVVIPGEEDEEDGPEE